MGGLERLTVTTSAPIQRGLDTIRVDLRQGKVHRTIAFPAHAAATSSGMRVPGVLARPGRFDLSLEGDPQGPPAALPGPWSPTQRVHLVVEGLDANRRITYRHREIFAFERLYPNGKGCPGRSLLHRTSLRASDRLAVPVEAPKIAPYTREMLALVNQRVVSIAARHPGFVSLQDDLTNLTVTVTWEGPAPSELRKYAATWPNRVRIDVIQRPVR
ncbi:MAG: hypothetical protein ACJ72E_03115 [Marmoricola sp.]